MQCDAHVPQLLDSQQRRDDVLAKAVVYKHLKEGRKDGNKVTLQTSSSSHTGLKTLTFHTGSAAVFFGGGALKLSIRFRATVSREGDNGGEEEEEDDFSIPCSQHLNQYRQLVTTSFSINNLLLQDTEGQNTCGQ